MRPMTLLVNDTLLVFSLGSLTTGEVLQSSNTLSPLLIKDKVWMFKI